MSKTFAQQYGPLVQQMLAGETTPAQLAELETALTGSPDLRAWFDETLETAALLRWEHAPTQVSFAPSESSEVNVAEVTVTDRADDEDELAMPASLAGRAWLEVTDVVRRPITPALLVAGLTVTFVVLLMALLTLPTITPDGPSSTTPPLVATVISVIDAEWQGDAPNIDLAQGDRLHLVAGAVELQFDDGAMVMIAGPAQFDVTSAGSGYLHSGKLTARVPERAIGFKVVTPVALLTDLGTEFGVSVEPTGSCEFHVFSGRTEVELTAATSTNDAPIQLAAGEALRVERTDSGGVSSRRTELAKHMFVRSTIEALLGDRPMIGVDFQRGEEPNRGVDILPDYVAGLVPQKNWNVGDMPRRPLGTKTTPIIDGTGKVVDGLRIDWNTNARGSVVPCDASLASLIVGDFITSDRTEANPTQLLKVTVTGLPEEYRRGGYSLICYQHTAPDTKFDTESTIRLDCGIDGSIDAETKLASTAKESFRITNGAQRDFDGFYARFEIPEAVVQFEIIVDAPPGKLATLSGIQILGTEELAAKTPESREEDSP